MYITQKRSRCNRVEVVLKPETKYNIVFKRRVMDNFDSLPHGFDLSIQVRANLQINYLFTYLF